MEKSILIKDTTQEERAEIVRGSLGIVTGSCDGCAAGLIDMYDDYIYGEKEISEINASFRAHYVTGDQNSRDDGMSCMNEPLE